MPSWDPFSVQGSTVVWEEGGEVSGGGGGAPSLSKWANQAFISRLLSRDMLFQSSMADTLTTGGDATLGVEGFEELLDLVEFSLSCCELVMGDGVVSGVEREVSEIGNGEAKRSELELEECCRGDRIT